MPLEHILLSGLIVFIGFVVFGLMGFGSGLVMLPLLMLFLDPKLVIPTACLIAAFAVISMTFKVWKQARKEFFLRLVIGSVIGVVIGTYGLVILESDFIRRVFAGAIILFALQLLFERPDIQKKNMPWITGTIAGLIGGVTGALFGMGGPPIVWYLTRQTANKEEFRATIVPYFAITTLWILISFTYAGLLTRAVLTFSLYMLPAMALGTLVGHSLHLKINQTQFRKIVAIVLLVTSFCLFCT